MSKYEYIDSQKAEPTNVNPVVKMCRWLEVSTSGFYHWLARPQSATSAQREALTARIQHYFKQSDGTYGYRRIHADLRRKHRVFPGTRAADHAPGRPRGLPAAAVPHHDRG